MRWRRLFTGSLLAMVTGACTEPPAQNFAEVVAGRALADGSTLAASDQAALQGIVAQVGLTPEQLTLGDGPNRFLTHTGRVSGLILVDASRLQPGQLGALGQLQVLELGALPDGALNTPLPQLRDLTLRDSPLTSLSFLAHCPAAERVTVTGARVQTLADMPALPNLVELVLTGAQLTNLASLGNRPALTRLRVDHNPLTSLAGIEGASGLTQLSARHAQLRDLSPIAPLAQLRGVDFTHNQIADVRPLAGLTALTEARLRENPVDPETVATLPRARRDALQAEPGSFTLALQQDEAARRATFPGQPLATLPDVRGATRNASRSLTISGREVSGEGRVGTLRGTQVLYVSRLDPTDVISPMNHPAPVRMSVGVATGRVRLILRGGVRSYVYADAAPGQDITLDANLLHPGASPAFYLVALDGEARAVRWTIAPR